jgi:hypothetical protein
MESAEFRHTPLEHGNIRLIRVSSALSADGLTQCTIRQKRLPEPYLNDGTENTANASVSAVGPGEAYMCLSYTWGDPLDRVPIRVDGKLFKIRTNLWNFLYFARETSFGLDIFIDALCVDQNNTLERNQQVQRMGQIYSGAEAVLMWLGHDPKIQDVLYSLNRAKKKFALQEYDAWNHHTQLWLSQGLDVNSKTAYTSATYNVPTNALYLEPPRAIIPHAPSSSNNDEREWDAVGENAGKAEKIFEVLAENEYWSRAWVTQEVLLAKNATIVAGTECHHLSLLADTYRRALPQSKDSAFENLIDIIVLQQQRRKMQSELYPEANLHEWGVIQLLHRFRTKQCAIPRDRIYSLLALSWEGQKIKVDYDIPEEQLMRQVLSIRPGSVCLCSTAISARALAPWEFSTLENSRNHFNELPFAELHMYACALSSVICPFCQNYTPSSWGRKKGVVFCLKTACPDTQGHIFWEQSNDADCTEMAKPMVSKDPIHGLLHTQVRSNNRSQLLFNNGGGLSIIRSEWMHVYLLRFTLRGLIEVLQDDIATDDLGLRACGNLWPSDSNIATSGEAKLKLCGGA